MPATLTTVNNILKEIYEPDIQDQLNNETVGLKRIERTSDGITHEVGGKYVTFPIRTRRNSGIGARNEMEALPLPGQQGYAAGRLGLKYLYGSVRFTGQTLKLADKNYQAFASAVDNEMKGLKNDLKKDQNRQFYGTTVGTMATATALGTGVNVITVDSVQYLEVGMQIDITSTAGTVKASNRQITAINLATRVVTFDGAVATFAVADVIVRTGNVNREMTGLKAIVTATGILYNIDPAVEPSWAARVDSNAGTLRPLSEGLVILSVDEVYRQGGNVSVIFSNLGVRRAYFNLLVQQRRFTNTQEFTGGFKGLAFTTDHGDIPWVTDVDAPYNTIYGIDESEIKFYRENEWSFMDEDGSYLSRVQGFDAYDATLFMYSEMGTHKRNAHFVIQDVTEG